MIQADLQGLLWPKLPFLIKLPKSLVLSPFSSKRDPHSHPPITLHHSLPFTVGRPFVRRRQMVRSLRSLALVTNQGGIEGSSSCSSSPRGTPADTAQLWSRLFLRTLSAPPKPLAHTLSYLTQPNQVLLTYRKLITLPSCGAGSSFAQRSAQTTRTHTPLLSYATKPNQILLTYSQLIALPSCGAGSSFAH